MECRVCRLLTVSLQLCTHDRSREQAGSQHIPVISVRECWEWCAGTLTLLSAIPEMPAVPGMPSIVTHNIPTIPTCYQSTSHRTIQIFSDATIDELSKL